MATEISTLQMLGAIGFGALVGWYVYYVNRYRRTEVQLTDLVTLIGVLGGGVILTVFPESTDLFGGYGIGLAIGFFGYFIALLAFVAYSPNFDFDWFLDGRRMKVPDTHYIPDEVAKTVSAMGGNKEDEKPQAGLTR